MAVYCWGSTKHGQLGLGGIEEEVIKTPHVCKFLQDKKIQEIACGVEHTLILMQDGLVYTCGNNDHGQLGHDKSRTRPALITTLEAQTITKVACGYGHNLVVSTSGQVFSWGKNTFGQLGTGDIEEKRVPKLLKTLSSHIVIQVCCGFYHSMALTKDGQLYVWGCNSNGQLGIGDVSVKALNTPQLLKCLSGLPVALIAAGGFHNFVLTSSGTLYGWGKNNFGQLGISDEKDCSFPTQCRSLRNQRVKFITCGEDHTVALTQDGGVFTYGAGMYGQLGHSSKSNESLPRKVFELMGSTVTQVSCGRKYTLAFVPSTGRMYAFGMGGSGQLGCDDCQNRNTPYPVKGSWISYQAACDKIHMDVDGVEPAVVKKIHCGGDQCIVIAYGINNMFEPDDFRIQSDNSKVFCLSKSAIDCYASLAQNQRPSLEMTEEIETVFSSPACLNGSFLLSDDRHYDSNSRNHGVDLHEVEEGFNKLGSATNRMISQLICSSLETHLIKALPTSLPDVEALRIYLILPYCHLFRDPNNHDNIICDFGEKIAKLDTVASKVLEKWWGKLEISHFALLITIYKQCIKHTLNLHARPSAFEAMSRKRKLQILLDVLKKLYAVNEENCQIVPYDSFYISELIEKVHIKLDYMEWVQQKSGVGEVFYFCNYPFIFDAQCKTLLLQQDAVMQMQAAVDEVTRRNLTSLFTPTILPMIDVVSPCLILQIHRERIVEDTINQLTKQGHADFKKPLKVEFIGEEAIDDGGVAKEFFLLLLKEILDPKYGMFQHFEESRLLWFSDLSFEDSLMFSLIGKVCGLAIYNNTIIDVPFPVALYKKLLKRPVTLDDLKELDPSTGRSLQQLLDYEGDDFEQTFDLNFEITREKFGEIIHVELIPDGTNIFVNQDNKNQFIEAYIDYVFSKCVHMQFHAFYEGFHKVCGGKVLELFHPRELQAMIVGNENYDWNELEKNAEYKGEYHINHVTIKLFWEIFRELKLEQRKQFLLFLTGSDRIPILGMKVIKIYIQSVGGGDNFLPVAHTCFNLLDLPKYSTKERLKSKLLIAIEHTHGFGIV